MNSVKIWLLGTPLDVIDENKAALECIRLLRNKSEEAPYTTFLDTRFLLSAFKWDGIPLKTEGIDATRRAAIQLPSKALEWLMRLFFVPQQTPFDPNAFFNLLTAFLSQEKLSLFVVGTDAIKLKKMEETLFSKDPTLHLFGFSTFRIETKGRLLEESKEMDDLLLNEIEIKAPDILILDLPSPTREIWFERNRSQLKTPLVIGMELQDSSKLYDAREAGCAFSGFLMNLPFFAFYHFNRFVSYLLHTSRCLDHCKTPPLLFLSPTQTMSCLRLPCSLDSEFSTKEWEDALAHDVIVVDFKALKHLDLYGYYALFHLWQTAKREKKPIFGINAPGDIRCLLRFNKLLDYVKDDLVTTDTVIQRLGAPLYESIYQHEGEVEVSFFGALTNDIDYNSLLLKLTPIISNKKLILDLAYTSAISSRGFWLFLNLKRLQENQGRPFSILKPPRFLTEQFREADLMNLLK